MERWQRDLDAYLTRGDRDDEPEPEPDDCMGGVAIEDTPDRAPCGRCAACLAHAAWLADEHESPEVG